MSTLLYNPGVKIALDTYSSGQIDVSNDLERVSLTLNENNCHTLTFTLSNDGGKYNSIFTPNDSVIVQMKRLTWLQTFTGYLTVVPYFSVYNRSVHLSAQCTLKRALYHWWDPGYAPALQLLQNALTNQNTQVDGGMSNVIKTVLTEFIGWEQDQIHIGSIPADWMNSIVSLYSDVQASVSAAQNTAGSLVVSGAVGTAGGSLAAPTWNGNSPPPGTQLPMTYGQCSYYSLTDGEPANSPGSNTQQSGIPLTVDNWWSAMHWGYGSDPNGSSAQQAAEKYLGGPTGKGLPLLVSNAQTNQTICVRAADYMANASPNRAIDLSPTAFQALGFTLEQGIGEVNIAWAPLGTPPGPYSPPSNVSATNIAPTASSPTTIIQATGGTEAANFAINKVGLPYGRAGGPNNGIGPNESSYDCSSLVASAWQAAGQNLAGTTSTQWASSNEASIPFSTAADVASLNPGDLLYVNDVPGDSGPNPQHVAMYVGNDTIVEAGNSQTGVHAVSLSSWMSYWTGGSGVFAGAKRVTGSNGSAVSSSGTLATAAGASTAGINTANGSGSLPGGSLVWGNWLPSAAATNSVAQEFTGLRVFMNDVPIMPTLTAIVKSGLRSYCTAPNGDFIAWFPDYFGTYGYASKWILSPLEMLDFNIVWSDANLITHQFVAGSYENAENTTIYPDSNGLSVTVQNELQTLGIATIDVPGLFQALFNVDPGNPNEKGIFADVNAIYQQFGARINFDQMPTVPSGLAEFFFAVRIWMESWASQFSANIPISFMPELFPGMLLVIQEFGFQAYITSVTHTIDLTSGGGFGTSVQVVAPSALDGSGLMGLARGA